MQRNYLYLCNRKQETQKHLKDIVRDGAVAARWAHNPKVVGSNPAPATTKEPEMVPFFTFVKINKAFSRFELNHLNHE